MCVHAGQLTCIHERVHAHPACPTRLGRSPTSTLVRWVGSQRVAKVACFALVAVDTRRVVDALQTPACQAVTVPGGAGVHIVVALTGLTRPRWATFPKGVPKIAIGTELTAGTWKEQTPKPEGSPVSSKGRCGGTSHPPEEPQGHVLRSRAWLFHPTVAPDVRTEQPDYEASCRGKVRWIATPLRPLPKN